MLPLRAGQGLGGSYGLNAGLRSLCPGEVISFQQRGGLKDEKEESRKAVREGPLPGSRELSSKSPAQESLMDSRKGPTRGRDLPSPVVSFVRCLSVRSFCPFLSWKKSWTRARKEEENHSWKRHTEADQALSPTVLHFQAKASQSWEKVQIR